MALEINFNAEEPTVQETIAKPVAGNYVCKILGTELNEERQYVLCTLDIVEGEYANYGIKCEERFNNDYSYLKLYLSYKPAAVRFLKANLTNIAKTNNVDVAALEKQFCETNGEVLQNAKVVVNLAEEEYLRQDGNVGVRFTFPQVIDPAEKDTFPVKPLKKLPKAEDDNVFTEGPSIPTKPEVQKKEEVKIEF